MQRAKVKKKRTWVRIQRAELRKRVWPMRERVWLLMGKRAWLVGKVLKRVQVTNQNEPVPTVILIT